MRDLNGPPSFCLVAIEAAATSSYLIFFRDAETFVKNMFSLFPLFSDHGRDVENALILVLLFSLSFGSRTGHLLPPPLFFAAE